MILLRIFIVDRFLNLNFISQKNKADKIIIIYDENEKIARVASTTLVQRGYDNIFMLSGGIVANLPIIFNLIFYVGYRLLSVGLQLAAAKFREGLVYGKLPSAVLSSVANSNTRNNVRTPGTTNFSCLDNHEFSPEDILFFSRIT